MSSMKIQRTHSHRGFTLIELMVSMVITIIIVTVLVSITSLALDTWNRSRSELRASRQAKAMIDIMARDYESLVTRRDNNSEWLSAISVNPASQPLGNKLLSTNASRLVFFSSATDRYDGQIGVVGKDLGGDVSCVAYQLDYKDPVATGYETFVLSRLLVNPNDAFTKLLGQTDTTVAAKTLDKVFTAAYRTATVSDPANFVCENIYQFSLTFNVQYTATGATTVTNLPITIGQTNAAQTTNSLKITGAGVVAGITGVTAAELATGRVTTVQISVTVLSDFGIDQMRSRFKTTTPTSTDLAKFLAKNSFQYTKLVQLPSL